MPIEFKDYYATLEVPRTASEQEIKKSFRKLARKFHPDVAKNKKAAEEKFKTINEAYEVLSDPEKRQKYDALGPEWRNGGTSGRSTNGSGGGPTAEEFHFQGTGFSDFFEQLFGRGSRSGFGSGSKRFETNEAGEPRGPMRGFDIEGDILVTLDEVMHGSVRSISLERVNPVNGKSEPRTFKVRIPIGVHEDQTIRVAGKGGDGWNGGDSGDLFLHVQYASHPDFRARGSDLYYELEVAPWEAVLGSAVSVQTLDGTVTARIPAGINNGQQLRLRRHGLIHGSEDKRGDLYLVVNVQIPARLSEEERELWEGLRRVSHFNPRQPEDHFTNKESP